MIFEKVNEKVREWLYKRLDKSENKLSCWLIFLHTQVDQVSYLEGSDYYTLLLLLWQELDAILYNFESVFFWRWGGSSTQAWMPTYVSILPILHMIWVWRATVEWYIDRGKPKNSEKNLSQCHFVHHKSHMDRPPREPGPLSLLH
jgi:hypothetical protein